jgi:protein involved in polysaccharide export with SLBB domain
MRQPLRRMLFCLLASVAIGGTAQVEAQTTADTYNDDPCFGVTSGTPAYPLYPNGQNPAAGMGRGPGFNGAGGANYNPNFSESYIGQGGYGQNAPGIYNGNGAAGQGQYNPNSAGGYYPNANGNYGQNAPNAYGQMGYGQNQNGSYGANAPDNGSSYTSGNSGPNAPGGYNPNAQGGYNPNAQGGYNPNAQGGYNPNAQGGYGQNPGAANGNGGGTPQNFSANWGSGSGGDVSNMTNPFSSEGSQASGGNGNLAGLATQLSSGSLAQLQTLTPEQIQAIPAENIRNIPYQMLQQLATPDNLTKLSPAQQDAVKDAIAAGPVATQNFGPDRAPDNSQIQRAPQNEPCYNPNGCGRYQPPQVSQGCQNPANPHFRLRRFGWDLFTNPPSTFAPSTFIPVPVDYVLGPGDTVAVQLFGHQNSRFDLQVQRDGSLQFPGLGPIQVAGLKFDEMRQMLQERISKQMIGDDVSVTLGALRSMQVFVVGDVKRPGSYTISALSKMLNALFVSGGVSDTGSFRRVQLKREGRIVSELDLYDLLLRGDSSNDAALQPGDVIFVPPVGPSVSVTGGVLRPAIYELKGSERIGSVLELAGGPTPEALLRLTKVERIAGPNDRRLVLNADLERPEGNLALVNGDVVTVNTVLNRLDHMVVVKGFVNRQLFVEWKPDLHISDVVPSANELRPRADLNFALLIRSDNPDRHLTVIKFQPQAAFDHPHGEGDLQLHAGDELRFFGFEPGRPQKVADLVTMLMLQSRSDPAASQVVSVLGSVQEPGYYPYVQDMVLKDTVDAAIGTSKTAWLNAALVVRNDLPHNMIHVFSVSLLPEDKDLTGFKIMPGDSLRVFGTTEYREPLLRDVIAQLRLQATPDNPARVVNLSGEVKFQGDYPLVEGATVTSTIVLAGGFREPAFRYDYEVTRQSVNSDNLFTIKIVDLDRDRNQIDQLGDVPPSGDTRHIVESDGKFKVIGGAPTIQGEPAVQTPVTAKAFMLQPRDTVVVRRQPGYEDSEIVTVTGEVRFPGTYRARRGENLSEVLRRAGGLSDLADPSSALFTREELRQSEDEHLREIQADVAREAARVSLIKGNANSGSGATAAQQQALLSSLADQLSKAHGVGRLVIDLPEIIKGDGDADVQVKNGDRLIVPRVRQDVTVLGEVSYQTAHRYQAGWTARDYLHKSGGYTQAADTGRVYVIRANGEVTANAVGWFTSSTIRPGDTIVVPLDLQPIEALPLFTSVASIIGNLAITAATLKVIGAF